MAEKDKIIDEIAADLFAPNQTAEEIYEQLKKQKEAYDLLNRLLDEFGALYDDPDQEINGGDAVEALGEIVGAAQDIIKRPGYTGGLKLLCSCVEADHPHYHCEAHGIHGEQECPGCEEEDTQPRKPDPRLFVPTCQNCALGYHENCPGETTLGTGPCMCDCERAQKLRRPLPEGK